METQRHFIDSRGSYFVAPFANTAFAEAYIPPLGTTEIAPPPTPEHIWINGAWATQPPPPAPTPSTTPLTMRQLRLGLLLIGGFPATFIQDAITAISDATQRGVAQIWYDESATVEWSHPMTQQLIAAAGITTEQAAAMWMQAKDLDA